MAKSIRIDQLAAELTKAVREYTEDVSEAIEKKVDQTADVVLEDVRRTARKRTGKYAKGFKKTKRGSDGKSSRVIWNKKHSRRVHLLEFGHAKRNGGRVRAFPHLRPAYEKYGAKLPDDIKRIIRNGGRI
ncbi:HK97 gp10 family phage protein [Paenibacillus larvae]|uniref:HK97 gp10 family phage protein n=1 Tax=Paenibacillus larvae TaxID=1464 RepID=A0AAP5N5N0_9BACL|nr:HK97 gp10 family phage protein [Paenibacillus larvae]ETK27193.1 phage-related protein [Paenibacillus larvae subsp. larvae DSM 25719]MCY9563254.1 HK97 gp10 family phage protein [Paenibacillus larvae]MCY9569064.1 HK97 gp10 family phage protein [Paenibacillus larvae]MCY9571915.1 HK97 gp10 family phage protein [Paenibacillus larvae]MCY9698608.1 HK97 gp10 family phage protein [Paenibacillus larvae]